MPYQEKLRLVDVTETRLNIQPLKTECNNFLVLSTFDHLITLHTLRDFRKDKENLKKSYDLACTSKNQSRVMVAAPPIPGNSSQPTEAMESVQNNSTQPTVTETPVVKSRVVLNFWIFLSRLRCNEVQKP